MVATKPCGVLKSGRKKDPRLREFYVELRHKRGEKKAPIVVARKMVSYAYWMLKRNQTYEELDPWESP